MTRKETWDNIAKDYAANFNAITDWKLGFTEVEKLLRNIQGKNLLDYGCGNGKFSRRLRDLGALVTAVDLSENAIALANQEDSRNIEYKVIRDDDLCFVKEKSMDYATATFVLCTMQQRAQIQTIVDNIYKKMKKGGCFVVLEPHPDSLGYKYISTRRNKPQKIESGTPIKVQLTGMNHPFYDYWRSIKDYKEIIQNAGFTIDTIKEPIIKGCAEETFWKDERAQSPFLIIRARK
jgi:2-polyprenyl-3-methyl-5-hydroxy-6-metoxy-1,4-benzoquinol methylase